MFHPTFILKRKQESKRKKNIAADVLGDAKMPAQQQFFGGMAANQTTFDGQAIRNQVAYAFKNRSMMMNPYQQGGMIGCINGMGAIGGMQPMYGGMMGGMNWAPAFETGYDNNNESSKKKRHKAIKKSVKHRFITRRIE